MNKALMKRKKQTFTQIKNACQGEKKQKDLVKLTNSPLNDQQQNLHKLGKQINRDP